jgi:hypothetical protein
MMVKLLLYAYCVGTPSSRKIEQKTYEDIAFRFLAASHHPDHDTIATFRKTHLTAIKGLFLEILVLCREAGLVKVGHISLDGTKIKANASKHKAMSYARIGEKEKQLKHEINELLLLVASAHWKSCTLRMKCSKISLSLAQRCLPRPVHPLLG